MSSRPYIPFAKRKKPSIVPYVVPDPNLIGGYSGEEEEQLVALDDLVFHFKFDNDADDEHSTNNLTQVNTPTFVAGKLGQAIELVKANDEYCTIADNAELSLDADTPFTICGWIHPTSIPNNGKVFLKAQGDIQGNGTEYCLEILASAPSILGFQVGNNVANQSVFTAQTVFLNLWTFVLCEHDPTNNLLTIALNNNAPVTAAWAGGTHNGNGNLLFGSYRAAGSAHNWDGYLDSWSFFKRLLTADEKTALYNAGDGLDYPFTG